MYVNIYKYYIYLCFGCVMRRAVALHDGAMIQFMTNETDFFLCNTIESLFV
jgi:hypothetical protein